MTCLLSGVTFTSTLSEKRTVYFYITANLAIIASDAHTVKFGLITHCIGMGEALCQGERGMCEYMARGGP